MVKEELAAIQRVVRVLDGFDLRAVDRIMGYVDSWRREKHADQLQAYLPQTNVNPAPKVERDFDFPGTFDQ